MTESRRFLSTAIASALDFEVMSPDEVFHHVSMDVLAHHLPEELKSRLLRAALEADAMNAMLILDTLGVDAIAEHAPVHLLWQCVADAASRSLGREPSPAATVSDTSPIATDIPLAAPVEDASSQKRKPNRSARASRVGAGATSRSGQMGAAPAPIPEDDDSAFDVDTRVGADPSVNGLDGFDDGTFDPADEITSHGQKI